MAGPFYVYHGATTTDGLSWAGAYQSLQALDTAVTLAAGEIVYVASDHVDPVTYSAHFVFATSASGAPTYIISANRGTTAYEKATTDQINTSNGAYVVYFDGSVALYGIQVKSGGGIVAYNDGNESFYAEDCKFLPAANGSFSADSDGASVVRLVNCTIDCTADGTTARTAAPVTWNDVLFYVNGLSFANVAYRTGVVFLGTTGAKYTEISGADVSGFTNATNCELIVGNSHGKVVLSNIKTKSGFTFATTDIPFTFTDLLGVNIGPEDAPAALYHRNFFGDLASSAAIYRSGGASVESTATSWAITTTANCSEGSPYYTPWIYGTTTNGTKTFDLYIAQDGGSADLTDAEIWLEVEYMGTADSPLYSLASDHRSPITATAAAQTDDTTSTWTGITATYKQKLSAASVTVGESGLYRARVAVGKASATVYVDPKVTVT